jgi:ABC-type molybdate transport system substrate-binding protein
MITKPKIEIDIQEVERLAGLGFTLEEISDHLGIHYTTLNRRRKEKEELQAAIKRGKTAAAAKVSSKLMDKVESGDLGAIIWYEKTRRGLTDRVVNEQAGELVIRVIRGDAKNG